MLEVSMFWRREYPKADIAFRFCNRPEFHTFNSPIVMTLGIGCNVIHPIFIIVGIAYVGFTGKSKLSCLTGVLTSDLLFVSPECLSQ
jgi:hypothetical protein